MITDVVAALIKDGDRFMICQRPRCKTRGLLWEFPGGKVEKGESNEEALKRECREELAAEIDIAGLFAEVLHEYPDMTVRLSVYTSHLKGGYTMLEHEDIRFILPSECGKYDFCPADAPIIEKIQKERF